MASSGNFCTLNPLDFRGTAVSTQIQGGNLLWNPSATQDECGGTMIIGKEGVKKVYIEVYNKNNSDTGWFGIYNVKDGNIRTSVVQSVASALRFKPRTGQKVTAGTSSNYIGDGSEVTITDTIFQMAVDMDAGKIWWGKANAWGSDGGGSPTDSNVAFTTIDSDGTYILFTHTGGASVAQPDWYFNFGQDSTFQGNKTAGGNADANGFGDFYYAPPSGFLAMCSGNINISDDIDPAQTDDDFSQKQFGVVTYTGNATTGQAISGLGFQPDLVWAKMRSSTQANFLSDTSRGINKFIFTDLTNAEGSGGGYATVYSSFDSDGFTLGTSGSGPNDSGRTYVAWCWRANGGTTASNSDGSITTTVQANTKAGFSIITYTGTGANATIGHGLTKAPTFIMCKNRDDVDYFGIYHISTGATHYGTLPSSSAPSANSTFWNNTAPTSSVISLGSQNRVNGSSNNMVAYAWHDVEGYSKFGNFEGNANNDGPFVHTGFRPRMLFFRGMDTTSPWTVYDGVRGGGYNDPPNSPAQLFWNENLADHTSYGLDIYSNGFKLRTSNATVNASGTWMFGAWGDVAFKYNNTF